MYRAYNPSAGGYAEQRPWYSNAGYMAGDSDYSPMPYETPLGSAGLAAIGLGGIGIAGVGGMALRGYGESLHGFGQGMWSTAQGAYQVGKMGGSVLGGFGTGLNEVRHGISDLAFALSDFRKWGTAEGAPKFGSGRGVSYMRRSPLGHLRPENLLKGAAWAVPFELALGAGTVAYESLIEGKSPYMSAMSYSRSATVSAAGAFMGGMIGSVIPGPGTLIGAAAGGMAGWMLGDSKILDRLTGIPLQQSVERTQAAMEGYSYRNPFRPGAHPSELSQQAVTMRESALQALHKSPLNDRGRLLGREASLMPM